MLKSGVIESIGQRDVLLFLLLERSTLLRLQALMRFMAKLSFLLVCMAFQSEVFALDRGSSTRTTFYTQESRCQNVDTFVQMLTDRWLFQRGCLMMKLIGNPLLSQREGIVQPKHQFHSIYLLSSIQYWFSGLLYKVVKSLPRGIQAFMYFRFCRRSKGRTFE
ncbi:hypothetical protein OXYTRIMIC_361 [Oxytricha trifallax]|uniref:Uncharacterized protein n=1 Tax=Oxytricha trifallax TaxID=1172189 RepID=A0A073I0S5_9SPIT|nr:hypothetical protein OXYTRIMIC_361 [Oxytricha trifallax]